MKGTAAVQTDKEFASELTTTLISHYAETGKKFVWASVAKEDGMLSYDFATQLRRAEMHNEVYIKKIAGDYKLCLTKQVIKQVGEVDRATIFSNACTEAGKKNPRPSRLSRISMKILFRLTNGPRTTVELSTEMRISSKDLSARLSMLKKHQYITNQAGYWKNTEIGDCIAGQE
ncbi:hypothetical protein KKF81_02405 [Candidatus Micrarchaeota archaeon]|nr:hypothetical protein [Candidatus Micrarchaeota archaeon]